MLDFDTAGNYEFTLEDEVIAFEEVKKLYAALDKLEPLEPAVIERYYILDYSLGEIAKGYCGGRRCFCYRPSYF